MLNQIYFSWLKLCRSTYLVLFKKTPEMRNWKMFSNKEYANDLIYRKLIDDGPCMIARIGSTEMLCLTNYLGVKNKENKSLSKFVKGDCFPWWWEDSTIRQMQQYSGFFPPQIDKIEQFCQLMINDLSEVDILGSWLNDEKHIDQKISNAKKLVLEDLEPFFANNP